MYWVLLAATWNYGLNSNEFLIDPLKLIATSSNPAQVFFRTYFTVDIVIISCRFPAINSELLLTFNEKLEARINREFIQFLNRIYAAWVLILNSGLENEEWTVSNLAYSLLFFLIQDDTWFNWERTFRGVLAHPWESADPALATTVTETFLKTILDYFHLFLFLADENSVLPALPASQKIT